MQQNVTMLKARKRRKLADEAVNFLLAAIPVIGFVVFGLVPMVLSLGLSFTTIKSSLLYDVIEWNVFENYAYLFKDDVFYKAIGNTLYYTLNVPLTMAIGLYIAYLVNKATKCKKFFRSVFFIPYVCSSAAISLAWKIMYDENYGIFNTLLNKMGLSSITWIYSEQTFMFSTIIMATWAGTGFCIILYQAALANVNQSYYEAARIDGASEFKIFWSITFPAVSPTTFYLLVIKLIGSLQVMAEPDILAQGPAISMSVLNNADVTIVKYLYSLMFGSWKSVGFGVASAAAWILALFIMLITYVNFCLKKKWVNYDMN